MYTQTAIKSEIKFSIIVTSYNNAKFIGETLASILNQTYKNYEVIIIDDGSKDNSVDIIKQYSEKYNNFYLYTHEKNKNKGLIESTKLALSYTSGSYITFCESDDFWAENYLEEKYEYIKKHNENDIIVNNIKTIGKNTRNAYTKLVIKNLKKTCPSNKWFKLVEENNFGIPTFSAVAIKKDILSTLNFDSPRPAWLDWWLWRQCAARKYSLGFIDKKLTYWRIHENNYSTKISNDFYKQIEKFIEESDKILPLENLIKQILKRIFSIKNSADQRHKIINILGTKIKIKRLVSFKKILQTIFSVKNSPNTKHKVFTILGLEIKIKRKINTNRIAQKIKKHYKNANGPKILIVSHELSRTGAPKVALMLAQTINKLYKTSPITISLRKGPLKKDYIKNNLFIIDLSDGILTKNDFKKIIRDFDLVIIHSWCPTILGKYETDTPPMIWWCHEPFEQEHYASHRALIKESINSMRECWAGSPITQRGMYHICPNIKTTLMLYGVENITLPEADKSNTIEFLFPATIDQRKGQDVLLKALKELPENFLQNTQFTIIGSEFPNSFSSNLNKMAKNLPSVQIINTTIPFDELMEYYAKADCIIVPSRQDPMPMVATYAFMLKKLCIISDSIGTAILATNSKDCLQFKNGDYIELAAILKDVISNIDKYQPIANNGYEIYKKYFSMEQFEANIKKKLDNILLNK